MQQTDMKYNLGLLVISGVLKTLKKRNFFFFEEKSTCMFEIIIALLFVMVNFICQLDPAKGRPKSW